MLPRTRLKRVALFLLSLFFIAAGVNHFLNPRTYTAIMPPYLPAHMELVYVSGIFEVLGGLGVLPVITRRLAGWGLIALLFAVYPANIHMAMNPDLFVGRGMPLWAIYLRLPLQFVFVSWVYWATRPDPKNP